MAAPKPKSPPTSTQPLAHIRAATLSTQSPARSNEDILSSLRATSILASKPALPAELLASILDFLPPASLARCARVSRRLQEMVYDDTRWIAKLRAIGVWDEGEARRRTEEAVRRRGEMAGRGRGGGEGGGGRRHAGSVTLFDAGVEEDRYRRSLDPPGSAKKSRGLAEGFDELTVSAGAPAAPAAAAGRQWDASSALTVLGRVRSVRGHAREEFGRVYKALGPLYEDLDRASGRGDALVLKTYKEPEQQAQALASLKRFARCDNALGWREREQKLDGMMAGFESEMLQEFEQGYAAEDVEGRMRRYAHILVTLNGGSVAIDTFISSHPMMTRTLRIGNAYECLEGVSFGHVDLNPSQAFFEKLSGIMAEQADVIDKVFPNSVDVLTPFLSRVFEGNVGGYLHTLFDEAQHKNNETFVKAVSGTFEQALRFVVSLRPTAASPPDLAEKVKNMIFECYDSRVETYLKEELAVFRVKSEALVYHWEKELSEQEASTESFFMSNINRQAAKRDFLSSFKKVVMMPVTTFSGSKPATAKSTANTAIADASHRPDSPSLNGSSSPNRASTPLPEPPTTELAAKAAIMNSRLEGIKSLFSIEVALNLTHLAKACIERAALLVRIGGAHGEAARVQCEMIFTTLLAILGHRHIKNGFDKAVGHLGHYNPRQVRTLRDKAGEKEKEAAAASSGVEPLVTFLELVNVGDLIQQMIDVFYSQELIATRLTDRDDFLDPAVKEKKRFEQMLDERVAAGLNRGIDVLMDEVEYILATTQTPTDFNPGAASHSKNGDPSLDVPDIGPTPTAVSVVSTVQSHTSMLTGASDKNMLDVFTTEVGLRLFTVLSKHFKRQRVSVPGAICFIADINHYSAFVSTLRQKALLPYYSALREMSQIYLVHIDPPGNYFASSSSSTNSRPGTPAADAELQAKKKKNRGSVFGSALGGSSSVTVQQAKELATIVADTQRYHGIFSAQEVIEFAERRADWYLVRGDVERAMYGVGCCVM